MRKAVFFILLMLLSYAALTCECFSPPLATQYRSSAIIVRGIAIASDTVCVLSPEDYQSVVKDTNAKVHSFEAHIATTLKVSRWYKGTQRNDTFRVLSGFSSADCGMLFTRGKEYIIYAVPHAGYELDEQKEDSLFQAGIGYRIPPLKKDKLYYTSDCYRSDTFKMSEHNALIRLQSGLQHK